MADIILNILVRDEATAKLAALETRLRLIQENQEVITKRQGEYAGGRFVEKQTQDLQNQMAVQRDIIRANADAEGSLRRTIDASLGLDRTLKDAGQSARVLRTSLSAAAASDPIERATAALARTAIAVPTVRPSRPVESESDKAAREADIARSAAAFEARMAARGRPSAPTAPRQEEESAERLAQRLAQVKDLAASTRFSPEFQNTIDSLTQRLTSLAGAGAIGGAAFEQFKAARDLETQVSLEQRLAQAAVEYAANQRAIREAIDSNNGAELNRLRTVNAIRAAQRPASGASTTETIESTTGIARTEAAISSAAARGQQLANAFGATATRINVATGAVEEFNAEVKNSESAAVNWGQTWRHIIAIIDGALRGQRGQVAASFNALARDSGLGTAAIEAFGGAWVATGAVAIAALAAIGYEAEQAARRIASIRDAAGQLAVFGFGNQTAALTEQFDSWQAASDEYAGTVAKMQEAASKFPPAAHGIVQSLHDQAVAVAGITGQDPAKIFDQLAKAAERSPEALAQTRTAMWGLQEATVAGGHSIVDYTKSAGDQVEAYQRAATAGNELRSSQMSLGSQFRKDQTELSENVIALGALASAGVMAGEAWDGLTEHIQNALDPANAMAGAEDHLTGTQIALAGAIDVANSALSRREALLSRLTLLEKTTDTGERPREGSSRREPPALPDTPERRTAREITRAEIIGEKPTPEEELRHKTSLDNINSEAEARKADRTSQAQAASQRLEEAKRVAQTKYGPDHQDLVFQDPQVFEAANATREAWRKVEDEKVEITKMGIQAQINEEARGATERIKLQKEIIDIDKQEAAEGRGGGIRAVKEDEIRLSTMQRQEEVRASQAAREEARIAVQEAKGQANSVDEITKAWERYRATISTLKGVDQKTELLQSYKEELKDLQGLQSQDFSQVTESISGQGRFGNIQIQSQKYALEAQVAAHAISKEQMATQEANFTDTVIQNQAKQVESALAMDGLTEKQQQQLHQTLADLYAKDAEAQEQAQKQITAAIEAENEKRAKSFTQFFDTAGSALEKFVTEGITRSTTRAQALAELGKSLVGSAVKGVGSFISDYAGKALGPELGLTEEQSKGGLGDVLGNAVAKSLGLLKDVPQDKGSQAATLMSKAADEQSKAVTKFSDAIDRFIADHKKVEEVKNQVAKTSGTSTAPETSNVPIGNVPGSDDLHQQAIAAAKKYNVPPEMFLHQIAGESGFNPNVGTSSAGAQGIAQFIPSTAKQYNVDVSNTTSSLEGAAHYMADLKRETGDWQSAMRSYLGATKPGAIEGVTSTNKQYAQAYKLAGSADNDNRFPGGIPEKKENLPAYGGSDPTAIRTQQKIAQYEPAVSSVAGPHGGMSVPSAVTPIVSQSIPKPSEDSDIPVVMPDGSTRNMGMAEYDKYTANMGHLPFNKDIGGPKGPRGDDYIFGNKIPRPEVDAQGNITKYGGPQGGDVGAKTDELNSSVKSLDSTTQSATTATQTIAPAVQQSTTASQQDVATTQQNVAALQQQKISVDQNTGAIKAQKSPDSSGGAASSSSTTGGGGSSSGSGTGQTGMNLNLLTQGLGIAATAASVFGRQLSTQARTVLGAVGILSQVAGFAKNAGSALDLFGTTTKTTQAATTLLSTANTTNTAATAANTLATTANSTADTANSASKTAGSAGGLFGGLFSAIGSIFTEGGIVPSAAGGMIVPGAAMAGGGQVSILHPREMVLPANLSDSIQRNMGHLAAPQTVSHSNANANLNYAPSINGRFGTMSRSEVDSILRSHGDAFSGMARNMIRNNGLFR